MTGSDARPRPRISQQTKAVIASAIFFVVLAAVILHEPEPDLVPSPTVQEQIADADHQVQRRQARTAAKSLDILGQSLADWSSHGEGLSTDQRADLLMLSRDARILSATLSGSGSPDLSEGDASTWQDLHRRIEATFAGD